MRTNTREHRPAARTHEGAPAVAFKPDKELRRAVLSCLLWENSFYESGVDIATRITKLVAEADPVAVAALAVEAREAFKLRHAPLLLLDGLLARRVGAGYVGDAIARTVQRADEMGELIALYQKRSGKDAPLAAQLKRGLAEAFTKFDAYQLGKYDREGAWRLRDVMFMVRPKPKDGEQAALWAALADRNVGVPTPDTWEVALSGGADKKETFERLLRDRKLGYLALLRNLRNMDQAGVDEALVNDAILHGNASRVLPFRFVTAARHAPRFEPALDQKLLSVLGEIEALPGRTVLLVDVSGSMNNKLSGKTELSRIDAAATLASMIPGDVRVLTFSDRVVEVPRRLGMAGVDAIKRSQPHSGTYLGKAVEQAQRIEPGARLIVLTDEQSHDPVPPPKAGTRGYMVNVASYQNGVGYGPWTRIDGFSETVLRYIAQAEREID